MDPESSTAEVAQAAMILDQLPTLDPESEAELSADLSDGSPADLVNEQRWSALLAQLSPVVGGRLAELADDRARLLASVSVPRAFFNPATPDSQVRESALLGWKRLFERSSTSDSGQTVAASESLSLLRLARRLRVDSAPELQQGLRAVRDATTEADIKVENLIPAVPQESEGRFASASRQGWLKFGGLFTWPPETASIKMSANARVSVKSTDIDTQSLYGIDMQSLYELEKISPDDMMSRYIRSAARLALQDDHDSSDSRSTR